MFSPGNVFIGYALIYIFYYYIIKIKLVKFLKKKDEEVEMKKLLASLLVGGFIAFNHYAMLLHSMESKMLLKITGLKLKFQV